jgi:L-aspartate oxidase
LGGAGGPDEHGCAPKPTHLFVGFVRERRQASRFPERPRVERLDQTGIGVGLGLVRNGQRGRRRTGRIEIPSARIQQIAETVDGRRVRRREPDADPFRQSLGEIRASGRPRLRCRDQRFGRTFLTSTVADAGAPKLAPSSEPRTPGKIGRRAGGVRVREGADPGAHPLPDRVQAGELEVERGGSSDLVRHRVEIDEAGGAHPEQGGVHRDLIHVLRAFRDRVTGRRGVGARLDLDGAVAQDIDPSLNVGVMDPCFELPFGREDEAEDPVKATTTLEHSLPLRRDRECAHRTSPVGRAQREQIGDIRAARGTDRAEAAGELASEYAILGDRDGGSPIGFERERGPGQRHARRSARRYRTVPPRSRYTHRPGRAGVSGPEGRPLIIGSGIAGLYVALRAKELGLRPTIVTKSRLEESNTRYAQGGIAAALGPDDSPARHLADTVRAGAGLVDLPAARILTHEAPRRIADLVRYGVPFDTVDGRISLGREAAHSRARILHAGGDATGLSIEETLKRRVLEQGIDAHERTVLRALRPGGAAGPVAVLSRADGKGVEISENRPVVLATGGAGSLYRESSNPSIATGEGVAIAFRAGALLTDMEFIQFHPTVFAREGAPRFLITEALRGEGAVLRNAAGERFLVRAHPDAELAPRDIVARAIRRELDRTGQPTVFLDATALPPDRLYARFPTVTRFLATFGLDPARDMIPVAPMAHFMIGGVTTDVEGRSTIPALYACGEVASTGVHGANRLASNSLLEGLVFGERVARHLLHPAPGGPPPPERLLALPLPVGAGHAESAAGIDRVRATLWTDVGIVRDAAGLRSAVHTFEEVGAAVEPATGREVPGPLANAALTAFLIARAALRRTESRGAHFRSDHPATLPSWRRHIGLVARPVRSRTTPRPPTTVKPRGRSPG